MKLAGDLQQPQRSISLGVRMICRGNDHAL
jgi:hypothetical protein